MRFRKDAHGWFIEESKTDSNEKCKSDNIFQKLINDKLKDEVIHSVTNNDITPVIEQDITNKHKRKNKPLMKNKSKNKIKNRHKLKDKSQDNTQNTQKISKNELNNKINTGFTTNSSSIFPIKTEIINQKTNCNDQKRKCNTNNDSNNTSKNNESIPDKIKILLEQIKEYQQKIKLYPNKSREYEFKIRVLQKRIIIEQEIYKETHAFDDKLMENFETTDILVTDIYHKPKENHFNQTVSMHLKDLEYNPKKERKKYSYNNVLKVRKNKHEKEK